MKPFILSMILYLLISFATSPLGNDPITFGNCVLPLF